MIDFALYQVLTIASILTIQYGTGLLVLHKGIKVNYTRKMNHFAIFFIPLLLGQIFSFQESLGRFVFSCAIATSLLVIYTKPLRRRVPAIATMFRSFDRPEDRPHTLWWLFTQILAGYLILIPMVVLFVQNGLEKIVILPVLINAIGDGLAEPVGVRFGRHKYRAYALFSSKRYVRSIEGSACVFLSSVILLFAFRSGFSQMQLSVAFLAIPLVMTVAEAISPHTWDTPVLNATGYGALYAIMRFV